MRQGRRGAPRPSQRAYKWGIFDRRFGDFTAAVDTNDGHVFKTVGDSFCAAFATATDALTAALEAQLALICEPWPEPVSLKVRMTLHTGAVESRDGDYFGPPLNRVARLLSTGYGGQSLLSQVTYELVRDNLPRETGLRDLGKHRLKDLARPEPVFQLTHPDLPAEFPPLKSLDNAALPNNLPQQVTSFIGREKELAEVQERLAKTKLLTLTGAGGSGKSRLSLQAAADLSDRFPDGAFLVELAPLADPTLVASTVASVLGVREELGKPILAMLTESLKEKKLLLLLDNCEHVLDASAKLADALIRNCANVRILATSREGLGIGGETTYRVPSLSLPDPKQAQTADSLSQFESVRLFIDRALQTQPNFAVTNANAPALASICFRLDGIPLAIELAAARVRSLPVEQINDRLDSRFRLLTGGDRSALPRQQTLRALVDWSHDLLMDQEKTLLARLSVFAGGWTLEAAEAVGAGESVSPGFAPVEDFEVLDLLTSLADKSLVLAEEESGDNRYRMLETIRQYAADRLSATSESASVQVRHRAFFLALAEEAAPLLDGSEQVYWLNRLEIEHDNIRAILEACATGAAATEATGAISEAVAGTGFASGEELAMSEAALAALAALTGLRLSAAVWRLWYVRGYLSEGREQLTRALAARSLLTAPRRSNGVLDATSGDAAKAQAATAIAAALHAGGSLATYQGDYAAARAMSEESLSLFRQIDDKNGIAVALNNLGNIANSHGDYAAAQLMLEEGLSLTREIGDKSGIAASLNSMGNAASDQGDFAAARVLYEECLSLSREIGNKRGIAIALNNLGYVASNQGDYAAARVLLGESLSLARETGGKRGITYGLEGIAFVSVGEGNARRAVVLWAAAGVLRDSMGAPLSRSEQAGIDAKLGKVRAEMGEAAFAAAWAEGRALPWEQAVELALR